MPGVISALYCRLCYCALTHPPSLPLSTKHTLCLSVRATSFLVLRYFPVFSHRVPVSFSFIFFLFFRPSHPLLFTSVCPSPTVVLGMGNSGDSGGALMFQRGRRKGQESEGERWRSKTRDPEIEMMEKEKNRDRGGRAESWRETRRRRRGGL